MSGKIFNFHFNSRFVILQENTRPSPQARTWTAISRLNLPVSKTDNGAQIKCSAEHEALNKALDSLTDLTIHCKPINHL